MVDRQIVNKVIVFALIAILLVAVFLVLKPLIIPLFLGVLLSYLLHPFYKRFEKKFKNKNWATGLFMLIIFIVVAVPAYFFLPALLKEVFDAYLYIQKLDLPGASLAVFSKFLNEELARVAAVELNLLVNQFFSYSLESLGSSLSGFADLLFKTAIMLFTFFFATRDSEKIKKFLSDLSPFSTKTEEKFDKEFRLITNSVLLGQIVTGLIQGLAVGLALWILGVPKVLFLTVLAVIVSIIPVVGAWLVWAPVSLILFLSGNSVGALILFLYGALFVSTIDNIIRPLFISKGSNMNIFVAIIGTVGGLYAFGIIGLLIGPLILSYMLIIIEFYKQGKLNDLFRERA